MHKDGRCLNKSDRIAKKLIRNRTNRIVTKNLLSAAGQIVL